MEDFLIIVICIIWILLISIIFIYLDLDKYRFRIRRVWGHFQRQLDEWVHLTGALLNTAPSSFEEADAATKAIEAYSDAKSVEGKSDALSSLWQNGALSLSESSGEISEILNKRDKLSDELSIFCMDYNRTSSILCRRLDAPVIGKIARMLRFYHYEKIEL